MTGKVFDIVVFGASGVTGKFIAEELAIHGGSIKWAVAGRSRKRLIKALADVTAYTGIDLGHIEIIIADSDDLQSLDKMCQQTKVIINSVGPFRFYGENVVKSCVACCTHYVDVCGEPQFLEEMQVKYFHSAHANNVYIIGSCGFDSIPCDMGVQFLKQKFIGDDPATPGDLNSVESFLEFHTEGHTKINFATWQSAVHSFSHASELKSVREKLRENIFTKFADGPTVFQYRQKKRPLLFKSEDVNRWCLPFPGSDRSVVTRSQMYYKQFEDENPVQIQTYFCMPSLLYALLFILMGALFMFLSKFAAGRFLLEKYPEFFSGGLFTKNPPPREESTEGSFTMTLSGTGWSRTQDRTTCPDKKMVAKVTGPSAGYVSTSICAVAVCKILLDPSERQKMVESGGVLTPAAAFAKTELIQKLEDRGLVMTIVEVHQKS